MLHLIWRTCNDNDIIIIIIIFISIIEKGSEMQDMERAASANARLIQDRQALIKICGDMRRANCKWINWLRLAAMFFFNNKEAT